MKVWFAPPVALGLLGAGLAWGVFSRAGATMGEAMFGVLGLMLLAAGIALKPADVPAVRKTRGRWRMFALSGAAYISFPLLVNGAPSLGVPSLGLMVAVYTFTWIESTSLGGLNFARVVGLASFATSCYVLFALLLGWQVQVWPTFLA